MWVATVLSSVHGVAHPDPGVECPTGPPAVQVRNLAAALLLAHGVPMFAMGDEYGHSKVRTDWRACTVLSGSGAALRCAALHCKSGAAAVSVKCKYSEAPTPHFQLK